MTYVLKNLVFGSLAVLVGVATAAGADGPKAPERAFSVTWNNAGMNDPLSRVHFLDTRTGWAVGSNGAILATTDAGATWRAEPRVTERPLYGVYAINANTLWAVGAQGTILSKSGNEGWQVQKSGVRATLRAVAFAPRNSSVGWVAGIGGTILATVDGGKTWKVQDSPTPRNFYDLHVADASTAWAVGTAGTIIATTDAGQTWRVQTSGATKILRSVFFIDSRTGWVVGLDGVILRTTDAGATWQTLTSNTDKALYSVHFADARTGWAVGDEGVLLGTTDGGDTWQSFGGVERDVVYNGVYLSGPRAGWVVSSLGTILTMQAGPTSWRVQRQGMTEDLWDVQFVTPGVGWAVGAKGTVLATRDGGASWQRQTSNSSKLLNGLYFVDEKLGWVVGADGEILRTRDGGATWLSLQPPVTAEDLSGVQFVNAQTGWAIGTKGTVIGTRDGGEKWEVLRTDSEAFLNGLYFIDASKGWAVGEDGLMLATSDGGKTWLRIDTKSLSDKTLNRVRFIDQKRGWAVGERGAILATTDGGQNWTRQTANLTTRLLHVYFANAYSGWVVGDDGTLLSTRDGGMTWRKQPTKTEMNLNAITFADPRNGWIVGDAGTILRSGAPVYAPWAKGLQVKPVGGIDDNLHTSFEVLTDGGPKPVGVRIDARAGKFAEFGRIGQAKESGDRWAVTWKPADYGIGANATIEFQARLDDNEFPPLGGIVLGSHVYKPWLDQIWEKYGSYAQGALVAFGGLFAYVAVIGLILLVRPAWPAYWGSAPVLDDLPKPGNGTFAFVWELARKALGLLVFPWLSRRPRVRRAWIKLYTESKSRIDDLGKARAAFMQEPDVLDAWVARSAKKALAAVEQLELYEQRRIYVELPVRVGERGKIIDRPNAETLRYLFERERAVVGIVGGGGSGKSTLACALARWALAENPDERLVPHRMIPVFIMQETNNLVAAVTQNLRRMLGEEDLPEDLVRGLLAKRRILVIIDALSEREAQTQTYIEQVFGENVPINAIVITSRSEPKLYNVDRTTLFPLRLDAGRVVPFIIGYLDRMEGGEQLKNGRAQLRLGDRILGLAESGGQRTAVTPLLVTLFVKSAVERAGQGLPVDDMPTAVPEVFVDYLRRLNSGSGLGATTVQEDVFIRAAQTLATASLGKNLVPQDFTPDAALAALQAAGLQLNGRDMIDRMVASGVIERRKPGGFEVLRFSLDPAAEYLAAIKQLFVLRGVDRAEWDRYLATLTSVDGYPYTPEGYLTAFGICYRAYRKEFGLPSMALPWERAERSMAA